MASINPKSDAFEIPDMDDYDDSEGCPNCGGEGWVSGCFEEFACIDPEEGCDDCMRRCDWCWPPRKKED